MLWSEVSGDCVLWRLSSYSFVHLLDCTDSPSYHSRIWEIGEKFECLHTCIVGEQEVLKATGMYEQWITCCGRGRALLGL